MTDIFDMIVKRKKRIALHTTELTLENAKVANGAQPGQFLHISIPYQTLRRPISIANVEKKKGLVTIILKEVGVGTEWLASVQTGTLLNVIGPCGTGFSIPDDCQQALLIGGGVGIPPLYFIGKQLLKRGVHITSLLGFQTRQHMFYEKHFQTLGKTFIVTDDGSYGYKGFTTDWFSLVGDYDCYYACGPLPMLHKIKNISPVKRGYISLEERMSCGIGACYACAVKTTGGEGAYKRICQDGPVFTAEEIIS